MPVITDPRMVPPGDLPPPEEKRQLEIVSVPTDDKASIEIIPFGTDERIKLSVSIVQKLIAVPTRTGKIPDANQCIKFMMLCRARHLNPFEGDAYLIGYDTQSGAQFSLITAHQVFLKRAEASKGFSGMQSGVIVLSKMPVLQGNVAGNNISGDVWEREGDITYDGETLLGGWAKVYQKGREHPMYRRLKLSTFNTNQSRWAKDPAGMIVKCAEADALRSAFPTHLGGLYVEEERPPIDISSELVIQRAQIPKPETISPDSNGHPLGTAKTETAKAEGDSKPAPSHSGAGERPPSKKKPERLKRKTPSTEIPPNQKAMLERLALGGKGPPDLLKVAVAEEWCSPEETWPLPEDKLEQFLDPENWAVLMEAMDKS